MASILREDTSTFDLVFEDLEHFQDDEKSDARSGEVRIIRYEGASSLAHQLRNIENKMSKIRRRRVNGLPSSCILACLGGMYMCVGVLAKFVLLKALGCVCGGGICALGVDNYLEKQRLKTIEFKSLQLRMYKIRERMHLPL